MLDLITVVLYRQLKNWDSQSDPGNLIFLIASRSSDQKILSAEWKNLKFTRDRFGTRNGHMSFNFLSGVCVYARANLIIYWIQIWISEGEYLTEPRIASYHSSPRTRIYTSCMLLACEELYCTLFPKSFRFWSKLNAPPLWQSCAGLFSQIVFFLNGNVLPNKMLISWSEVGINSESLEKSTQL